MIVDMPQPYVAFTTSTMAGAPSDALAPPRGSRRWIPRTELVQRLRTSAADTGLRDDLERLAGESTDDLPPLA